MIASRAREVSHASGDQVNQSEGALGSSVDMASSAKAIADSVQTMATSTVESSASILEVCATIEQVDENVDTLSDSVVETTSSVQQMIASIKEVADNVQYLTKSSSQAMEARALLAAGYESHALDVARDIGEAHPRSVVAVTAAAEILTGLGRFDDGAELLRACLEQRPGNLDITLSMAVLALQAERDDIVQEYSARP